jgi:alpha-D-ribose 1-methylphosphonate 5-triphosphate synthase subunit PhnH
MLTFARREPIERADFVIVDGRCDELNAALRNAKCGTLNDPHESATIIALAGFGGNLDEWRLAGPGIDGERSCRFSLAAGWDTARAERNREFPLGVDLVLISEDNRLAVLPRTTRVASEVA